jgi:hypothetical protein
MCCLGDQKINNSVSPMMKNDQHRVYIWFFAYLYLANVFEPHKNDTITTKSNVIVPVIVGS